MIRRERLESINDKARLPRSVQAVYLRPLRRKAEFGLPVCDLQLRSYSVRNVEFFADFAVRAAYYLNLPVSGPVPLPRIVERWTVPRSNFVHKKSQENFERITLRRLVQIKDGNPQVVQTWLAFLRKHAFYGVGMKANVWEHESLGILQSLPCFVFDFVRHVTNHIVVTDVAANMDSTLPEVEKSLQPYLSQFGHRQDATSCDSISDILDNERFVVSRKPSSFSFRRWSSCQTPRSPCFAKTIFSGIQPTGVPHLGNYLGALREWVKLQDDASDGTRLYFSIVDLHALTVPQESAQLRQWRKEALATLVAAGLDPDRSTIFYQSSVSAHAELFWILCTVASMGYLSRMTQWKSKLQLPEDTTLDTSEARSKLRLGLFSYPVLQAADILVHRFVITTFTPAKRVMSLKEPTLKMSKSHVDERSRILLTDSPGQIHKKLKAALTDSETTITYDPLRRPGVSNLLELLSHFEGRSCEELVLEFQSASLRALKENLAHKISNHLQPVREKYFSLMEDKTGYLEDISEKGARAARANAELTMTRVREAMGL
ncbi:hypothetical protein ASPTUDRAFT_131006 [Aspergillus tubingensis CBS 134.48]|uniref:Small ribosomal subunit protein uS10m n=2 Tax=Aspergillus subgen. Circumdati TaxID=2720871 RepID=A0A1L9MSK2_ASPTC|nr:hypothetical protein ASPTUDRAFT_131006 [Aspergillus tubingensis CBS 134.48]